MNHITVLEPALNPSDHDILIELRKDVKDLVNVVKGNGSPGLAQRVANLELWRAMLLGAWLLGAAAITIYAAVKTR